MRHDRPAPGRHVLTAAALAGLLAAPGLAQEATLRERIEEVRLELLTGSPTPALRATIAELETEARERSTQKDANATDAATLELVRTLKASVDPTARAGGQGDDQRGGDAAIVRALSEALARKDMSFVNRLGSRAVPALETLVRARGGAPVPNDQYDPLGTLARFDAGAALDLVHELLASPSFLVKNNALRVTRDTWDSPNIYTRNEKGEWVLRSAKWLEIPARAFAEPAVEDDAVSFALTAMLEVGQVPKELEERAIAVLPQTDIREPLPRNVPLYRRGLASDDQDVRGSAVKRLLEMGRVDDVAPLVNDTSTYVRAVMGQQLIMNAAWTLPDPKEKRYARGKASYPTLEGQRAELLTRLLEDEDENVRSETWSTLTSRAGNNGRTPLTMDEALGLAGQLKQGQSIERLLSAAPETLHGELIPPMLERLQALELSREERVRAAYSFVGRLNGIAISTPKAVWSVVEAIAAFESSEADLTSSLHFYVRKFIMDGVIDPAPVVGWMRRTARATDYKLTTGSSVAPSVGSWLQRLNDEQRRGLVEGYCRAYPAHVQEQKAAGREPESFLFAKKYIVPTELVRGRDDLMALALAKDIEPGCRAWAFFRLGLAHAESLTAEHIDEMASVLVAYGRGDYLSAITVRMTRPLDDALALEILGRPEATDELVRFLQPAMQDPKLLDAALARFPSESWEYDEQSYLVKAIIRGLVRASKEELDPRLERASFKSYRVREEVALQILLDRTPALFPVAARLVREGKPGQDGWFKAVDAVAGYFTTDAAAVLLEAAKDTRETRQRDHVMGAIQQMTEWREAAATWERGADAERERRAAIDELVALLDNEEQPLTTRAGALRGLGLLGAAWEMPRIARALASPEPEMAAAARAAMESLEAVTRGNSSR